MFWFPFTRSATTTTSRIFNSDEEEAAGLTGRSTSGSSNNADNNNNNDNGGLISYGSNDDAILGVHHQISNTADPSYRDNATLAIEEQQEQQEQQQPQAVPYDDAVEDVVTSLTRRIRCLFSVITWPIVPLGTIASLALGWLIYASFVLDVGKSCSHPLHWYAVLSLILVMYAPYHSKIRSFLFNYNQREHRGSERPLRVRRYDQLFHTLALIYVYAGITLVQTCCDDISVLAPPAEESGGGGGNFDGTTKTLEFSSAPPNNTCAATCPNLFVALRVYVATIEIFTFSLILPLLFLPCLYLYFIRRTMQDAESLAALQDRFREEEAMMRNGGVTTQEIMDQFDKVQLVRIIDTHHEDEGAEEENWRVVVVKEGETFSNIENSPACNSKECCICMESFTVHQGLSDEEMGGAATAPAGRNRSRSTNNNRDAGSALQVIRARTCGHLFHRRCIASWVGGRWQPQPQSSSSQNDTANTITSGSGGEDRELARRARRTTCPLCRQDVRPNL